MHFDVMETFINIHLLHPSFFVSSIISMVREASKIVLYILMLGWYDLLC